LLVTLYEYRIIRECGRLCVVLSRTNLDRRLPPGCQRISARQRLAERPPKV